MTEAIEPEQYVVRIEDLSVNYGQTPALRGVCLNVREGEYLGIIGPNGGGKSTLLKAILGLIPISNGSVRIFGTSPKEGRNRVGYVPQFALLDKRFPITLEEVVLSGRIRKGISPFFRYRTADHEIAHTLMERVGIGNLAGRQIAQLSGGEFQKMLIARALATKPRLLILDEPTASVDAASREQIYELLSELNDEMTIILVTHDMLAISSEVKSIACLSGELVYHGEPALTPNVATKLYGCPVDLIAHGVPHRVLREHEKAHEREDET